MGSQAKFLRITSESSRSRIAGGGIYHYNMTLPIALTKQRVPYNWLSSQSFPMLSLFHILLVLRMGYCKLITGL